MLRPVVFAGLLAASSGCPSVSTPAPAANKAAAATDGPRFDVAVDAPTRAVKGKGGLARITVSPRAPWHVNLDYVPKLRLAAPGVVFDDGSGKPTPERFDADGVAFAVPFQANDKGTSSVEGEVQFAVCAEDACAPQSVPVAFTIDVDCDAGVVC